MSAVPVNTLMEESKCYLCLGISQTDALKLALLSLIQQNAGGGSGSGVEAGTIVMWSGSIASIPSGWVICDGTNGTPDLRNRFLVGAGSTYAVGATGGATTHTHTATLSVALSDGAELNDIAPAGNYLHTGEAGGSTNAASSLPPYYALAYIMKT